LLAVVVASRCLDRECACVRMCMDVSLAPRTAGEATDCDAGHRHGDRGRWTRRESHTITVPSREWLAQ
jgi:hypothetical protein